MPASHRGGSGSIQDIKCGILVNNTALGQIFLTLCPFIIVGIIIQMVHTDSSNTNGIQS